MSYLNAPATALVATRCLCCRRPLVDAESLARGVGPDCAEKYGFYAEVPEEVRKEANAIIYRLAADPKVETLEADLHRLASLGFQHIVEKVAGKLVKVTIEEVQNGVVVRTPYSDEVVQAMRAIPGRRWNKEKKVNEFPVASKAAVFEMLKKFYAGKLAKGPKGLFAIPAPEPVIAEVVMADEGAEEPIDAQAMYDAEYARLEAEAVHQPPPGSWAETARLMAAGDDSGFDWDRWKDEMKDREMGL